MAISKEIIMKLRNLVFKRKKRRREMQQPHMENLINKDDPNPIRGN